jgi:hypothetical protein
MSRTYVVYTDDEHDQLIQAMRVIQGAVLSLPVTTHGHEPQQHLAGVIGEWIDKMKPQPWAWDHDKDDAAAFYDAVKAAERKPPRSF